MDMMVTTLGCTPRRFHTSAKNNPMGRNIMVDETVPAIEYLLSDGSGAVTGQNIGITGGVR